MMMLLEGQKTQISMNNEDKNVITTKNLPAWNDAPAAPQFDCVDFEYFA